VEFCDIKITKDWEVKTFHQTRCFNKTFGLLVEFRIRYLKIYEADALTVSTRSAQTRYLDTAWYSP
jgi:hypothetical protein